MKAINYGTSGVIILELTNIKKEVFEKHPNLGEIVLPVYPNLPEQRLGKFGGYPDGLPQRVEVVWQLANLSPCNVEYRSSNYPAHVRKSDCVWTPIPGQVYRKTIDLVAIRQTPAYQRVGGPVEGSHWVETYTLRLNFNFTDEKLSLEVTNGQTLGMGQ